VPEPLPERLFYVAPLRRRMPVRFGGTWIAGSEQVVLFFEPGKEVDDEGNRCDGAGCANGGDEAGGAARAAGSDKRRRRSGSCVGVRLG
jgi:hypothetical protein